MDTFRVDYHFIGEGAVSAATDESQQPFIKTITGNAPPTAAYVGNVAGAVGVLQLALTADEQAQNVCVSMGDTLQFDAAMLLYAEFVVRISTALTATSTTQVAFGLASERNDAIDSIAEAVLFRVLGDAAGAVIVETDDGVTNNDDLPNEANCVLGTSWKRFAIDFRHGLSDVRVYGDDANGKLARLAASKTLNMSDLVSGEGLQFYAQLQKASSTDVGTFQIDRFSVEFKGK